MNENITVKSLKNPLKGEITIPADKSISHRSIILGALTNGKLKISNFSKGGDPISTLNIFKNLGLEVNFIDEKNLVINSKAGLVEPSCPLDCGNSGTTMRLVAGLLSAQRFNSTLFGDVSLSRRPMKRIIEPLSLMGAKIESNENKAPLKITGSKLKGITYNSKIASAQIKSCLLLAGFGAIGETQIIEPGLSRNHTEIMFKYLDADIQTGKVENKFYSKIRSTFLVPKDIFIPGDISSAAFFMVAAAIVPNSDIVIKNVGLNETRTGIIDVMKEMKADIEILDEKIVNGEKTGDVRVKYSPDMKGIEIKGDIIPRLIDEIPVICVLAGFANGTTTIKDAGDLKNKESDRINCTSCELRKIGFDIEPAEDGFIIQGKSNRKIQGGVELETYHDHRLAMSFYVAGLNSDESLLIKDFIWTKTSFPEFLELISKLGG